MDLTNASAFTRRQFLQGTLVLASAAATLPAFLSRSALAMQPAKGLSSMPGVPEDRILVVVQLSGGNDGLNTVVPFGDPQYRKVRPSIGLADNAVLALDKHQGLGLHPALAPMKDLYDSGLCSIVQGVGYPNPNRSHFKSMDIWHTADTTGTGNGWLGRYFDSECCGFGKGESGRVDKSAKREQAKPDSNQPGIALGRTAPLAMQGQRKKPIAFENESLFRWTGQDVDKDLLDPYLALQRRAEKAAVALPAEQETNASFLMRTALDAQVSSDLIRKAVRTKPMVTYPQTELGRNLAMIAAMIRAELPTRVYYVQLGSFDTHAGQGGAQGRHAQLLGQFAAAMKAFYQDLKAAEQDRRVLTMSFSEFGRRVGQNASGGTDHGTAAPMFLFGPMVKPGVAGEHPSLTDLDDGDLKHRIDFRSVYAGILTQWLKADSRAILKGEYAPMNILQRA